MLPDHAPEPALCTSLGGSERCDLLLCFFLGFEPKRKTFWDLSQSDKLFEIKPPLAGNENSDNDVEGG